MYHELWKEVFDAYGIQASVLFAPYKRCKELARSGHVDAFPGGYRRDINVGNLIYPHWYIGVDIISVAYRKGTISSWTGTSNLSGKVVGWERGLQFDVAGIITEDIHLEEFTHLDAALMKLNAGRLDFILDYRQALESTLAELELEESIVIRANVITGQEYFMLFHDNEKGRFLAEHWDRVMRKLSDEGRLHYLYSKFGDESY
ncbi:hypothetical protein BTA51_14750 [Hahella sp. CCB-MM4]|nr:hypothetical protein BTA51_14750 [Hahella sp. CCB-MM4]